VKKIIVVSIILAAALSALSVSDNSLMHELDYSEKPYYIADGELIAEIGGLRCISTSSAGTPTRRLTSLG
jgi:hypothetical protein